MLTSLDKSTSSEKTVSIVYKDGTKHTFKINYDYWTCSQVVRCALEQSDHVNFEADVMFTRCSERLTKDHHEFIFDQVNKFIELKNGNIDTVSPDKPVKSNVMVDNCKHAQDAEFINKFIDEKNPHDKDYLNRQILLAGLIMFCNYLNIPTLFNLSCAAYACCISRNNNKDAIKEFIENGTK